ncbi:lovastatin nonaketide synthase [Astrocystis sublimbata]|nr:lovastatin nonaketide synthase [Astrocystis sublimbata]
MKRHGVQDQQSYPLAIIGLAIKFPQDATTLDGFWDIIQEGRSISTEFPSDRLTIDSFYHPDKSRAGSISARGGHFIKEDLGAFDAPFFSITRNEASCMDPQHRKLLEITYHALENAGIPMAKCAGSDTSVYTGCFTNDYLSILQQDYEAEQRHAAMGIAPSMLANRISWFFDLKGTSVNLDSACSSSLLALHLACRDLNMGTSSMALVGGANLVFHPNFMKMMANFNFLSPDSQCWSFDERANGYARGEGIAVLVIKRLENALRDGNTIRAVIRNTGSNQDGNTPGITQPSGKAQIDLIKSTYQQAGISMGPTRYFEAHATGTPIGDPIEGNAVGLAFRQSRTPQDPLYIGAVKSNIGHLEGCSGLAGVIKTVLVLERGIIPPIANFEVLNAQVNAETLHLKVNSFGFGGTNAIVILDDAHHYLESYDRSAFHLTHMFPELGHHETNCGGQSAKSAVRETPGKLSKPSTGPRAQLLVWSAHDEEALKRLTDSYRDYLSKTENVLWDQLSYTLAARRSQFAWRSFAIGDPRNPMSSSQISFSPPVRALSSAPEVAFVFTGQGAQYFGMGSQLLDFAVFRDSLEESETQLRALGCEWSIMDLFSKERELEIDQPQYSQPLTTCLQVALVDLLRSLNVIPSLVLGHSSGEIAAAYASGSISKLSAIKVAYFRGYLSAKIKDADAGSFSMMAVGMSKSSTLEYLSLLRSSKDSDNNVGIEVGCINSPENVTLSGRTASILTLQKMLAADGIFNRRLHVQVPYHTTYMDGIAQEYLPGEVQMISSVTGNTVAAPELITAAYWVRNLISPVEFHAAFCKLSAMRNHRPTRNLGKAQGPDYSNITHVMEIGPHATLRSPIREIQKSLKSQKKFEYVAALALGEFHCSGHSLDLLKINNLETPLPMPPSLPQYPFSHSQSYWVESSLSQNLRFRGAPHWNPYMGQWRNIIRTTEVPWLKDHTIGTNIVLPAAAMLSFDRNEEAGHLGCVLRDTIETQLTISKPFQIQSSKSAEWSQFRLFFLDNAAYTECSSGLIRSVKKAEDKRQIAMSRAWGRSYNMGEWSENIKSSNLGENLDAYNDSVGNDIQYGPSFRAIHHMRLGKHGEFVAGISTKSWKASGSEVNQSQGASQSYLIHPILLDSLAQPLLPCLRVQMKGDLPTMVPIAVKRIYIAFQSYNRWPGEMELVGSCQLLSHRGSHADVIATVPESDNAPLITMEGLRTAFISTTPSTSASVPSTSRRLCYQLQWRHDIDTMSHQLMQEHCIHNRPPQPGPPGDAIQRGTNQDIAIMCFILNAIRYLDDHQEVLQNLESHLISYTTWLKYQANKLNNGLCSISKEEVRRYLSDTEAMKELNDVVAASGMEGYLSVHIGKQLNSILSGAVDPLRFLFEDGLLESYYEAMLSNDHYAYPGSQFVDLLAFKNPSMKILEIGAGTGGQTKQLLQTLHDGVTRWETYDYTDISPSFFPNAREKFHSYGNLRFQVLDISKDPIPQNFRMEFYDLVIASHVLHATKRLDESLRNVRKLLRPNGKLLLFEATNPDNLHFGFIFGLLKGWWSPLQYDTRSTLSPCLTGQQWDLLLRRTGFSGVDMNIPGQPDLSSIMVSTASPVVDVVEPDNTAKTIYLIPGPDSATFSVSNLQAELARNLHTPVKSSSFHELVKTGVEDNTLVIVLKEIDQIFLHGISELEYDAMKTILLCTKSTLWVARGGTSSTSPEPFHHLAQGLGRTLMSEDPERMFLNLLLDPSDLNPSSGIDVICRTVKRMLETPAENSEDTLVEVNGGIQISRVTESTAMNHMIHSSLLPHHFDHVIPSRRKTFGLRIQEPGHVESLAWFEDQQNPDFALADDEVVISVEAIGLNYRDSLVVKGHSDHTVLGSDCAGRVIEAGRYSGFNPGDRVNVISGEYTAKSVVKVNAYQAAIIPDSMTFLEAASLPTPTMVSFQALFEFAHLKEGNTVLIHQAHSCVGQMMIQLAMQAGARVLITTSSASKKVWLTSHLNVVPLEVVDLDSAQLVPTISHLTGGAGVDIIVGPISQSGSASEDDFAACLAPLGHLVDTTLRTSQHLNGVVHTPRSTSHPNITKSQMNLDTLLNNPRLLSRGVFRKAMKLFVDQSLEPPQPLHFFSASESQSAFRHLDDANIIGKRIIEFDHGLALPAFVIPKPRYSFSSNASYIIGGGLGGLGRSVARWLVDRGAKHLILLSRKGGNSAAAKTLVEELEAKGARIATPAVDMSNLATLKAVLQRTTERMPPIRGCIQATVVLRDNIFANMSYDDWVTGVNSKVACSWNLHSILPNGLDFFVTLSSLNGIVGNRGQANYSAGNTFKDSLAYYRVASGEKAVSIDLGLMVAEGLVAENTNLLASLRRIGHLMDINQAEFLALMDYYCDPNLPILPLDQVQVLVGLEAPAAVLAKNIDLHHAMHRPMFRRMFRLGDGVGLSRDMKESIGYEEALRNTSSTEEAGSLVTTWFQAKIAQVLGLKVENVDTERPVHTYGMDSLVAIDLKNWFFSEIGADIQIFLLMSNSSLSMVAREAAKASRFSKDEN